MNHPIKLRQLWGTPENQVGSIPILTFQIKQVIPSKLIHLAYVDINLQQNLKNNAASEVKKTTQWEFPSEVNFDQY